jgi:hypothetical protein
MSATTHLRPACKDAARASNRDDFLNSEELSRAPEVVEICPPLLTQFLYVGRLSAARKPDQYEKFWTHDRFFGIPLSSSKRLSKPLRRSSFAGSRSRIRNCSRCFFKTSGKS